MNIKTEATIDHGLAEAVESGLSAHPKKLPSWLFYDAEGDRLFQQIMALPEYYLTRSELDILVRHKAALLELFSGEGDPFELVELGAGDGTKTQVLLEYFLEKQVPFTYRPVDISESVLAQLTTRLQSRLPELDIQPVAGRYEELADLVETPIRKVFLFMGANIGNFEYDEAMGFLRMIREQMTTEYLLLVGFDLKKDPKEILAAYDDAQGVTRAFNLNLLRRLNTELGADFDLDAFRHHATYDPQTGETRSYLVSTKKQTVDFPPLDMSVPFASWETIHTEISLKYDQQMIEELAAENGLKILHRFDDSTGSFCDVLFRVKG